MFSPSVLHRTTFFFVDPKKPCPGPSQNKSSLSLAIIVRGTTAEDMIPADFPLATDGQNKALQVWNTRRIKYLHLAKSRFVQM